jgi:TolA-binding protein
VEKKFYFEYVKQNHRTMPSELTIERNGKKEIKFKAFYAIKGDFVIFSEKFFGYKSPDDSAGKIRISYSNYKFNKDADLTLVDQAKTRVILEQEADAEKLFQNAKELIMDGKNDKAKKILQKIVKNYPETTYAKQAQTLLDGLPE